MARQQRVLTILMADDDADDRLLVEEAFKEMPVEMQFVEDGVELMDYLYCRGKYKGIQYPRPDLLLLDLNMPRKDGRQALAEIHADSSLRSLPVVILTTSIEECEVNKCYQLGANTYVVKPLSYDRLVEILRSLHLYWTELASRPTCPLPPSCE